MCEACFATRCSSPISPEISYKVTSLPINSVDRRCTDVPAICTEENTRGQGGGRRGEEMPVLRDPLGLGGVNICSLSLSLVFTSGKGVECCGIFDTEAVEGGTK